MLDAISSECSDHHQRNLFNFTVHVDITQPPANLSTQKLKLLDLRRKVQLRMKELGYVLVESGHYSPADFAGMDYVLVSKLLDRYHFIDVTIDSSLKWQLPALRKMHVFTIGLDDDGAITDQTRQSFLEKLLELMEGKSFYLPYRQCPFPSLDGEMSAKDKAAALEDFRARLQERIGTLQKVRREDTANADAVGRTIDLIREYWLDLARSTKYTAEEATRQTDPNHLRRQRVFDDWAVKAAERAVRALINEAHYPPRLGGHSAEYNERRDQIDLLVRGTRFKLEMVSTILVKGAGRAWEKKQMTPQLWKRKHFISSGSGISQAAEFLVRLIESTPLLSLIGEESLPLPAKPTAQVMQMVAACNSPAIAIPVATVASGRPILTLRKTS